MLGNVENVCFNIGCLRDVRDVRDVAADIRMWEKWRGRKEDE